MSNENIRKRLYSPEFRTFYRKEILKSIKEANNLKIKGNRCNRRISIVLFFISIVFFFASFLNKYLSFLFTIAQFTFVLAISIPLLNNFLYILDKTYKRKSIILTKILSFLGDFEYVYNSMREREIIRSKIIKSRIFTIKENSYIDDYIKGTYKGIEVNIYEIKIKREKEQDLNFIYITMPCNKKIKGFTLLRTKPYLLDKGEKVKLEDVLFEKSFNIKSSNQIEARYLLTTAFMQRLLKLKRRNIFENIDILFEKGLVHILIPTEKDWFEILNSGKINERACKILIFEILSLFELIDILKLEQDIGL